MNRAEAIDRVERDTRKAAQIGIAAVGPQKALEAAALTAAKAVGDLTAHLKNAADHNDRQLTLTDEILKASNKAVMMAGLMMAIVEMSTEVSVVSVVDIPNTLN